MKKIISLVSYLIIPWTISCLPTAADPSQKLAENIPFSLLNQWRLGFGLGVEYLSADAKVKFRPQGNNFDDFETDLSKTAKHFQVAPCIEIGKAISKDYYLGLLLSWRHTGAKSRSKSPLVQNFYFEHELVLRHYTDLLLKVGYQFTPRTMVYGLIGPSMTKWSHTSRLYYGSNTINKFLLSKNDIGIGFGFGMEYLFKKNYALSIDFVHHIQRPTSKNQFLSYTHTIGAVGGVLVNHTFSGDVNKKIDLSFSTIAVRFTTFFSL